jgi:hypothetical protein
MAETHDAPGMFSFFGNDPGGYSTMEMRRRIALQMMAGGNRKGYPKNIGEGLASIGDSLGEIGIMRALLAAQAKQDASSKATAEKIYGPGSTTAPTTESPPVRTSSVDPAATPTETTPVETPPVDTAAIPAAPSMGPDTEHFTPQAEPIVAAPPTEAAAIGSDAGSRLPATFADRFNAANPPPLKTDSSVPLVTAKEQPASVLVPKSMTGELEGGVETGPDHAPAFAKTSRIPIVPDATSTTSPRAEASTSQHVVDSGASPITPRLMSAIKQIESGGDPHSTTKSGTYKGLYQLSDKQFRDYGGQGDIYDPAENTRVGALVIADEAKNLSKALGRPVTPDEVYLAHQQGFGGATEHLTHPERPAWQSMYATAEGRHRGEGWARQAIHDNLPSSLRGRADSITSGEFAELWRDKYNHFAGEDGNTRTASHSPRAAVAQRMVANNVQPPQPDDQDALLSDVLAVQEAKNSAYPQTASLGREGDIQSDAPPVGGIVGPATGNAIAATAAARRGGITSKLMQQPPIAPTPQGAIPDPLQTDPRLAEANLLSPVATDVPKSVPTQRFRTANDAIAPAPSGSPQVITPQAAPAQAPPQQEQMPEVLQDRGAPRIPAPEPMSPREVGARRSLAGEGSQDPIVRGSAELVIKEETDRRNRADAMRGAQYQEDRKVYDEITKKRVDWTLGAQKRQDEAATRAEVSEKHKHDILKAQDEENRRRMFGNLPPEDVIKEIKTSKDVANSVRTGIIAVHDAREALKGGAITGSAADFRLGVAKAVTALGFTDKGDVIANTETFRAAMAPVVASILHATVGTTQLSEGDRKFAERAAGGNIALDPQSIERLMGIIERNSGEVLRQHHGKVKAIFGDSPQGNALFGVEAPTFKKSDATAPQAGAPQEFATEAEAEAAHLPRNTIVIINGRRGKVQ